MSGPRPVESPSPEPAASQMQDSPRGFAYALTAYFLWGFLPVYLKTLSHVGTVEVLAHRVIWSVPVALAVLIAIGRTDALRAALRSPRMIGMAAITATLITVNWGIYVWAIQNGYTLDAALGYYINPLFSVFLGWLLLGERLTGAQKVAIGLAALAVAILAWESGRIPLISLSLTATWGFYAYFKKSLPIGPNQGFTLEVMLLFPFAIGYAIWLGVTGQGSFLNSDVTTDLLLVGCGLVTAVPLMLYANGAKLLRLSTIGIMQYIAPTMIFLTAIIAFDEPIDRAKMIAFPIIWTALIVYTGSMIVTARRARG